MLRFGTQALCFFIVEKRRLLAGPYLLCTVCVCVLLEIRPEFIQINVGAVVQEYGYTEEIFNICVECPHPPARFSVHGRRG